MGNGLVSTRGHPFERTVTAWTKDALRLDARDRQGHMPETTPGRLGLRVVTIRAPEVPLRRRLHFAGLLRSRDPSRIGLASRLILSDHHHLIEAFD
jgi:hypothetical protein